MREIKFKAFCKKENKIYDVQSIEFVDLIEGRTGINVYAGEDIYEECKWLEEGEYVLMQFTGLKDKNGKEIYEGDIFHLGDIIILYVVEWIDSGFKGRQISNKSTVGLEYWQDRIEIIGNIHDNSFDLS